MQQCHLPIKKRYKVGIQLDDDLCCPSPSDYIICTVTPKKRRRSVRSASAVTRRSPVRRCYVVCWLRGCSTVRGAFAVLCFISYSLLVNKSAGLRRLKRTFPASAPLWFGRCDNIRVTLNHGSDVVCDAEARVSGFFRIFRR